MNGIFSDEFQATPYWWDKTPRPTCTDTTLPGQTDVLIVGSGYTGLNAGLVTARSGLETVIVDAESAGWGCSSRNGGQLSGEIKPGYAELSRRYGHDRACAIVLEARKGLDWIGEFIRTEAISNDPAAFMPPTVPGSSPCRHTNFVTRPRDWSLPDTLSRKRTFAARSIHRSTMADWSSTATPRWIPPVTIKGCTTAPSPAAVG